MNFRATTSPRLETFRQFHEGFAHLRPVLFGPVDYVNHFDFALLLGI